MVRQVLGRVCAGAVFFLAAAAACGGSAGDPIGAPSNGASSSGTSGAGGPRSPSCGDVDCAECPTNTREVPGECCPACEPIGDQCAGGPDSCANKRACTDGLERFEYATGCCDCRREECASVSCAPFRGCAPGEHVELAGCCPTCVKDASCKEGAPCNRFECPTGYKPFGRVTDGEGCCTSCEPDASYCDTARTAYDEWLERRLAQKGTLECEVKEDCELVVLSNTCKDDCGHAVAKNAKAQLVTDVTEYAAQHCKDCPKVPIGCPAVVLQATCFEKRCRLAPH